MYDLKCRDLALAFLEDSPAINTPEHASALAQQIQDAIEDYLAVDYARFATAAQLKAKRPRIKEAK